VGIKGVGMTSLALVAQEAGVKVTGSDIADDFITDELLKKAGITVQSDFSREHILDPELVITTGAHGGFENIEVLAAKEKNIPIISQGEAVGAFMKGDILGKSFVGISVAGSHGKTTTTAIIATLLKSAGMDPSYSIGTGVILSLGGSGHFGKGDFFVAEADEYITAIGFDNTPKLLWQHPKIAVFTNIDFDHPDVYENEEKIREVFLQFARALPPDGILVACGDDVSVQKIAKEYAGKVITYGFSDKNSFVLKHVHISLEQTFFHVETDGTDLGEFSIGVSGEHNALNALASIIVALEAGVDILKIKEGLKKFVGTKRRAEFIGKLVSGALIYDDYAHHPTEIRKTLAAFKKRFPNNKLVCVFQPHMYSRTKKLFEQFIHSFSDADTVILSDIYPSLREKPDPEVSSRLLQDKMRLLHKHVLYLPSLENVVEYLNENSFGGETVLLTMGAGDVYKIADKLQLSNA